MDTNFKTEIACALLLKILENEDIKDSTSSAKDIRQDAENVADLLHTYTEAILRKFEPPRSVTLNGPDYSYLPGVPK